MDYQTPVQKAGSLPYTGSDWLIPLIVLAVLALWAGLIVWWAE